MKGYIAGPCFIMLCSAGVAAQANTRADVNNAIAMVTVRGKGVDKNGRQVDVNRGGTGIIIGTSRYLLTARHVIEAPEGGWSKTDLGLPDVTIAVRMRDAQTGRVTDVRQARVHRNAAGQDAALLEFDGNARKGLATCPVVDDTTPGTQLVVAGIPNSDALSVPKIEFSNGTLDEPQDKDGSSRRVSAPTKEGFSGGAVFLVEQQDSRRLVGVLKGGQSFGTAPQSLFTPLSELRGSVLGPCPVPCRHPDHGIERYERDELKPVHVSDWQRGGSTSESYCGSYRSDQMNANPGVTVSVAMHENEGHRFFTGRRGNDYIVREAQYKFKCQLRFQWGPVYKLALSAKCPAAANPDNLPY